ncbi:HipA N-terminal domain-containing protein [Leptospira ilyithenensis]|uniref:HipA N-terminal subdomain 1 domain-containing protein n=1 Tax=Leptospira ilyithenensis TaxID=2484901 RepID=A0A4V3JXQ1_9LEPT|nr:HipA N-terminal domain-containing protein [Leptospira ilyithenensis]TGN14679.1 hypothetical protein EHS11_01435 [Leptospira ilyithenensis]
MRRGKVYFQSTLAGFVGEDEEGYFFQYDSEYLRLTDSSSVSFTLPKREEIYRSKILFPFFDGLIPEGWLLEITIKEWKLDPRDRLSLLLSVCQDCIGAVSVVGEE